MEEAAEARHREVMGQAEHQARSLQEALVHHEQADLRKSREVMGQENAEIRGKAAQDPKAAGE